jgi:protein involved in polysaccharide export with SLBB domain
VDVIERCTSSILGCLRQYGRFGLMYSLALCGALGCADQVRPATTEQRAAFEYTASVKPAVDIDRIQKAKLSTGPYRVVPGDVLEFTMPGVLQAVTAAELQTAQSQVKNDQSYVCRVGPQGEITLPAVGNLDVTGESLSEIEKKVVAAYQRYAVLQPSVFARVLEYQTSKVYIAGTVKKPGVYTLRADQMTLVSLLTQAEGISETGASVVRIVRSKDQGPTAGPPTPEGTAPETASPPNASILLPVVGMNIPFGDVALEEGDTVVVEQGRVPLFSVLGLVARPGNFPCPPTTEYTLMQAIAFAGGLDPVADPRYATIYRLTKDGSVTRVPFRLIKDGQFTEALNTPIKPGDVVAIEHTPRTRANAMINNMLRINTGVYVTGRDLWGSD